MTRISCGAVPSLYIDDPEQGIASATCHPTFVDLAPESFYDQGEHFSPFGNDSGYDALRALEDWYVEGGRDDALPAFAAGLIASWDFGVPDDVWAAGREDVHARLRDGSLDEVALTAEAQAQLAIVLGQLKIRGGLTPAARILGGAVVDVLWALADHSRVAYPNWPHAAENLAAIAAAADVIDKAPVLQA
ncbi:uncharacterized protein YfeS [Prescottella agglutinans]|uniref:Uncharacterized protein YfeS n=1 Tax=Prescottella agglutinans TaxID=1644129 RepID=A0ABT6MFF3_9NOCA|nr:uncharacterized protein YfeS [Prescottella agglutinans]